jgi:hypothetical protein
MPPKVVWAVLLPAALTGALLLPAGVARAAVSVEIELPKGAVSFSAPFSGPAAITFTFNADDPPDKYRLRLADLTSSAEVTAMRVSIDPATDTSPVRIMFDWPALSPSAPNDYRVRVTSSAGVKMASADFTVTPELRFPITRARPEIVYAYVRDGYRDFLHFIWRQSSRARTVLRVAAARADGTCCGAKVLTHSAGSLGKGKHAWRWGGRDQDGAKAPPGRYFIRAFGVDVNGVKRASRDERFAIKSKLVRRTERASQAGTHFARRTAIARYAVSGRCTFDEFQDEQLVTCRKAGVSLVYRWVLPKRYTLISYGFHTTDGAVGCRSTRSFSSTTKGIATAIKIGSRRGWSQCWVVGARISYSHIVRI